MSRLVKLVRSAGIITATGLATYYGFGLGDIVDDHVPQTYMIPELVQGITAFIAGNAGNRVARTVLRAGSRIKEQEAYSIAALNAFANAPNEMRNISTERSLEEISKHLVQVRVHVGDQIWGGSGLMITTDGYVLTAHHVIQEVVENGRKAYIKTQRGWEYRVLRGNVWYNEATDIAIVKVNKPSVLAAPIHIKVDPKCDLQRGQEVRILGFRDGQEYNTLGMITTPRHHWKQESGNVVRGLFQTDARGKPGQSGGVIVNGNGELIGITVYVSIASGEEIGQVGGARISDALAYINQIAAKRSSGFFK